MAFGAPYQYPGYPPYYPQPVPDQLAQLRQNQMVQPQPMMQPPIQAQPAQISPAGQPQQSNGMIWISGKAEADSYLIAPGCAVALWDSNAPVVYLRQADSTGKPSTKVYDLVERTEDRPAQQPAPQIDLSKYITREQLEEILAERLKRPAKPTRPKEVQEDG